jgi:hypothetical protein
MPEPPPDGRFGHALQVARWAIRWAKYPCVRPSTAHLSGPETGRIRRKQAA